jgi:hypothetical protein
MDRAQMGGAARRWFRLAVNSRSTIAHHGNRLFAPMKVRPDFSTAPAASGAGALGAPGPTAGPRPPTDQRARRRGGCSGNRRNRSGRHGRQLSAFRQGLLSGSAARGLQRGVGRRFLRLPASSRYLRNASWMKSETDRPRCEAARSIARLVSLGTSIDSSTVSVMRPMMAPIGPDGKALGVVVRQPRHRRPSVPPLRRKIG